MGVPATKQNYNRIGMPQLSKEFDVLVIDCTNLLNRAIDHSNDEKLLFTEMVEVHSISELRLKMESFSPQYAIDITSQTLEAKELIQILKDINCKLVIMQLGSLPTPNFKQRLMIEINYKQANSNKQSEKHFWRKWSFVKHTHRIIILREKIMGIPKRIIRIQNDKKDDYLDNTIVVAAGNKALSKKFKQCKEIIWSGSEDYHIFRKIITLNQEKSHQIILEPYILFIDENLPGASDWLLLNIPPPITEEIYFVKLEEAFQKIEKSYNLPIVIAGHPRDQDVADYSSKFNGRKVVFMNTARLVVGSFFVVTFASTAVSFAVLGRKPILFLSIREMSGHRYFGDAEAIAQSLGQSQIYVDDLEEALPSIFTNQIDSLRYDAYIQDYLCNKRSTEADYLQGFVEYVKKNTVA
jgi:hypothetical protein